MIIRRHLVSEINKTFAATMLVLLLAAVSNKLVRLISQAASGDLSLALLFKVISLQVPELVAFLLPLSLYLAILLCFSKAFVDNELTAIFACGFSWQHLLRIGLIYSMIVVAFVSILTLWVVPNLAYYRDNLVAYEEPTMLLQTVQPGRFYSFQNDKLVFYVESLSSSKKHLKGVFIAEQPKDSKNDENRTVLSASRGDIVYDDNDNAFVELTSGKRYEGKPGDLDYSVIDFQQYGRLIEKKPPKPGLYYHRSMPTTMLWSSPNLSFLAELQWRLSIPLSAPILVLIAIPLSRVAPRKGRFAKVIPAIIIYIIYYNLLTMCKRWVAQGAISPYIGLWWVHLLFLFMGSWVFAHASGRWHQFTNYAKLKVLNA